MLSKLWVREYSLVAVTNTGLLVVANLIKIVDFVRATCTLCPVPDRSQCHLCRNAVHPAKPFTPRFGSNAFELITQERHDKQLAHVSRDNARDCSGVALEHFSA